MIKQLKMLLNLFLNLFFPSEVIACEINKGNDMIRAHSELKKAGISRYKVKMTFSETPINGLTPPVMQVFVRPKHLKTVQSLL